MVVERAVKPSNLLAREEPGEPGGGIAPDVPSRVGRDVPADKRMVEDLAKEVQHLVGAVGCGDVSSTTGMRTSRSRRTRRLRQ